MTTKPIQLNSEQQTAVDAGSGYYRVLAGPGAGKSACLIARYLRLRETSPAEDILALTFTSEAAKELNKRVGAKENPTRTCGFRTLHSLALAFCVQEAKEFPYPLAAFPLATEGRAGKILGEASRRYKVDFRTLQSWISRQKSFGIRSAAAVKTAESDGENESLALAYQHYDQALREVGLLDFDSLMLEMVDLVRNRTAVRDRWSYRWCMVDESQDCSQDQWDLLGLISHKYGNLWAVGDVGQSIYQFRGAHPELFLEFEQRFPNAKTLFLGHNYRSTRKLVGFFKEIGPIRELAEKFHTENDEGVEPVIDRYLTDVGEAEGATKRIQELGQEDTAILSRTNRGLRIFEEWLSNAGIRYHLLSGSGFFAQSEIKSVLAFTQCAVLPHDSALGTALRSPFHPTKYLRKKEILDHLKFLQKQSSPKPMLWSLLDSLRHKDDQQQRALSEFRRFILSLTQYRYMNAAEAVRFVTRDLRAVEYYSDEEESPDNSPVENLSELVRIANRFESITALMEHVRKVTNASRVKKGVSLATIHAVKGKEASTVFLTGCQEGNLPHKNATDPEEENRLFFVGASRAKDRLFISYVGSQPSRFIVPFLKPVEELVI